MNEMKIRRHTPRTEEQCRTAAICIIELRQENQQLKDNWNKLKEWMQKELVDSKATSGYSFYLKSWLDKIQELEDGNND